MDNTEVLESVLMLAPTTLELGLTPLKLLHLDSPSSLQQEIADLVDARAASDRYAPIQIMSSDELKFLVDTFAKARAPRTEFSNCEHRFTRRLPNDIPVE